MISWFGFAVEVISLDIKGDIWYMYDEGLSVCDGEWGGGGGATTTALAIALPPCLISLFLFLFFFFSLLLLFLLFVCLLVRSGFIEFL